MDSLIQIDGLEAAVDEILTEYLGETAEMLHDAVDTTTKELVEEIRENARKAFPEGSGDYAKSWTQKLDRKGSKRGKYGRIAYAKGSGGSIAHLLEHGHAKVGGGYVAGRPHIAPAEKHAESRFPQLVRDSLAKGR